MAAAVHESPASALSQIRADPALGPGLVVFAVLSVYAVKSGASNPTVWYPGALLLLGLGAMVLYGRLRAGLPFARSLTAAAALFAAYVLVAYASITWSHAKGLAWDGANLTLLYLIALRHLRRRCRGGASQPRHCSPRTGSSPRASASSSLTRAASAHDPTSYFQLGRFAARSATRTRRAPGT